MNVTSTKLSTEDINRLIEIMRLHDDKSLYDKVKQYVFFSAWKLFDVMSNDDIKEPEGILFNENWKRSILNEVKCNIEIQNTIFNVNENIVSSGVYLHKWIRYMIYHIKEYKKMKPGKPKQALFNCLDHCIYVNTKYLEGGDTIKNVCTNPNSELHDNQVSKNTICSQINYKAL